MELWQIAVLLDKHRIDRPEIPAEPEGFEDRVAFYKDLDLAKIRADQAARAGERRAANREKRRQRREEARAQVTSPPDGRDP